MACIMCSGRLWRQLGYAGRSKRAIPEHFMPGVSLGPWAAKLFNNQGRDLVLALDTRTCLTLLLPFAPEAGLRCSFASALTDALHDAGVPPATVRMESAAAEFAPFVFLRNPALTDSLNRVLYFCELEFFYHDDLRVIQRNLNALPHPNRDPCQPIAAVKRLFHQSSATSCLN